ncbi:T3SS effector HopA1 family protein [Luteitalea pratensis]|nr:T3SS effector HopA1 family protein [Luteitalea pratensis]
MTVHAPPHSLNVDAALMAALRELTILSPYEYSFAGQSIRVAEQPSLAAGGTVSPQEAMLGALQAQFYGSVYNRTFAGRTIPQAPSRLTNMTNELSRANPGRERWDHGWQVYQVMPNGVVQAHKHGNAQMFYPGQYIPLGGTTGSQVSVQNGAIVSAYLAKELRNFQDGFYVVLSENVQPFYEQTTLVRIYWHLRPEGAVPMVRELISRFNRFQVPFRFKCLAYPELYDRFDAGVLFVGRRQWDITALLVEELYTKLVDYLKPEVPLFSKRLAPGLAFAEDPGNGESFGTSRCRLIAEGVWTSYQRGVHTESARLEHIVDAFVRAGIPPERPWLNPGSVDIYDVRVT